MTVQILNMRVRAEVSSTYKFFPVVFINSVAYRHLIDFMLTHQFAPSTNQKYAEYVKHLMDFMLANHAHFEKPTELFQSFVRCLYDGTVDENGIDQTGLYWKKYDRNAETVRKIVNGLSRYFDWLNITGRASEHPNPWVGATNVEQRINWAAYLHKKRNSFLSHLQSPRRTDKQIAFSRLQATKKTTGHKSEADFKAFPAEHINELLLNGFVRPGYRGQRYDIIHEQTHEIRDILITMLMHYGGLRISEPFHLWVSDVEPLADDRGAAYVRIFHPETGKAPTNTLGQNGIPIVEPRGAMLTRDYPGFLPRNTYPAGHKLLAGWKDLRLDHRHNFIEVQFFPYEISKLFLKLWNMYLPERNLKKNAGLHPFAFVDSQGNPHAMSNFQIAHKKAVQRIGLPVGQTYGTNPHGHRHSFGQSLAEHRVEPLVIMKAMHHKSIASQQPYTDPTSESIRLSLAEAAKKALNDDLPKTRQVRAVLQSLSNPIKTLED